MLSTQLPLQHPNHTCPCSTPGLALVNLESRARDGSSANSHPSVVAGSNFQQAWGVGL